MENPEPAVLLHEDVVNQISRLLGRLDILGRLWHELKYLVAAGKDAQQAGQHGQNGVTHLGHHNLRTTGLLIAKRRGQIVRHRSFALGRKVAVNIRFGVLNGLKDDVAELLIVHRVFVWRQQPCLKVVRRIRGSISRLRYQVWIVPAGGNAISHCLFLFLPATTASPAACRSRGQESILPLPVLHQP